MTNKPLSAIIDNTKRKENTKIEFIESPIYVKLSDEERNSLHEVYVILNDLVNAAEENDCEYVGNPLTGDGRFDLSQAAEICRVFAPAEKLEISN